MFDEGFGISDDGEFAVFATDTAAGRHAWLWSRNGGVKKIAPNAAYSMNPTITGDGSTVAFLAGGQKTSNHPQVYVVERAKIGS